MPSQDDARRRRREPDVAFCTDVTQEMPGTQHMTASSRGNRAGLVATGAIVGGLLAGVAAPMRCDAQAVEPREALEDAKLYFTAPLRWDGRDWLEFGGTLVALGVVHEFDDDVRDHFVGKSADGLNGDDPNSAEDALPAAVLLAGTWLLAGVTDEPGGWRELGSMLEASAFTAVSTEVLKFSLGRQRPNETTDPDGWFDGGDSFPSMHTSLAFAIGTVLAESGDDRYRWLRRILGYGVAGATAYVRLDHNQHWASDVAAGAALGFSTARFTLNRREGSAETTSVTVRPAEGGGVMLAFAMPLR
jgi:membrane-associated phospholipid phosphatase